MLICRILHSPGPIHTSVRGSDLHPYGIILPHNTGFGILSPVEDRGRLDRGIAKIGSNSTSVGDAPTGSGSLRLLF